MTTNKGFLTVVSAAGIAVFMASAAIAEGMHGGMGRGMMHGGGMGSGGMGSEMKCPMMRGMGMMGSGMMGSSMQSGGGSEMDILFGSKVSPVMNLSVDDVRGYLSTRLERLKNKRLKLGDVKVDDGAITADIVTADDSLVQRLKVDRHTGSIEYQD